VKKSDFKEEHLMKLQGKNYLPVAPRVVMFRAEHPDWEICTEPVTVGEDTYMRAVVSRPDITPDGTYLGMITAATAHKRVRKDGKGPAALWPLETAETGAIGRALALCGYGTLAGDLDEHDELADAPVEVETKSVGKKPTSKPKPVSANKADQVVAKLDAAKTLDQFNAAYDDAVDFLETVERGSAEDTAVRQAGARARNRVAG
jgi:hypothetical protein